jgi:hypothetical protein
VANLNNCLGVGLDLVVRRICHYITAFKEYIQDELVSMTHEKKEYFKVRKFFLQEDGSVDEKACTLLGLLVKNTATRQELEITCSIHFQY